MVLVPVKEQSCSGHCQPANPAAGLPAALCAHGNACSVQRQAPFFISVFPGAENLPVLKQSCPALVCERFLEPGFSLSTRANQMCVVPDAWACQNQTKGTLQNGV